MATAKSRYTALSAARDTVLVRAREAARLTIPGIVPLDGQNEHTVFEQPYQAVGARGVANLSSSLLLGLFPPNVPNFRLAIDEETAQALGTQLGEANMKLAKITNRVLTLMGGARKVLMEVLRHLVVAGNVLLHVPDKAPPRLFRLDQFVVKRDAAGSFIEIVVEEMVYPSTLSAEVIAACKVEIKEGSDEKPIPVYTRVVRDGGTVKHYQEINDIRVPNSEGQAPGDSSGWLPLRWLAIPGSDYGRSHVTEVIGDLYSLEDLSKAMVQFAAVAARIIGFVKPNAQVDPDDLAEAESGDFLDGDPDSVGYLQLEKQQDWAVMAQLAQRIEERVNQAFLIRAGTIRNAERVTAEEVQMVAQELETVLGGTYSVLAGELQLPLTRRYLYLAARQGLAPRLPDTIKPEIVTGFDALGRGAQVNRLRAWANDLKTLYGEQFTSYVHGDELAKRLGDGVEGLEDLVKTAEEMAADAQNQQMAAAGQAAAPQLVKAVADASLGTQSQQQ